jgi:tetratricopeptide (TPR) repeat protein
MARYAEAETYLSRVLEIRVRTLGSDHPDTGMASITLARLRQQQGRLDEAEALNRDALDLFEKALGSDHVYVSVALNNLAQVHKTQGRLACLGPRIFGSGNKLQMHPGTTVQVLSNEAISASTSFWSGPLHRALTRGPNP